MLRADERQASACRAGAGFPPLPDGWAGMRTVSAKSSSCCVQVRGGPAATPDLRTSRRPGRPVSSTPPCACPRPRRRSARTGDRRRRPGSPATPVAVPGGQLVEVDHRQRRHYPRCRARDWASADLPCRTPPRAGTTSRAAQTMGIAHQNFPAPGRSSMITLLEPRRGGVWRGLRPHSAPAITDVDEGAADVDRPSRTSPAAPPPWRRHPHVATGTAGLPEVEAKASVDSRRFSPLR